jgi:hypothetical protein
MLANEGKPQACDWSPASFPRSEPTWKREVRELTPDDKADVLAWCLQGFAHCGVTTPKDAVGLIRLLEAAGEDSAKQVAESVHQLLKDRDKVTWVLSLTAFADSALAGSEPKVRWGDILRAILGRSDPTVRQLFLTHLERRFRPPSADHDAKIERLCVDAGLIEPRLPPARNRNAPQASPPASGGLTAVLRSFLHWAFGRPDDPEPSQPPKRKGSGKK